MRVKLLIGKGPDKRGVSCDSVDDAIEVLRAFRAMRMLDDVRQSAADRIAEMVYARREHLKTIDRLQFELEIAQAANRRLASGSQN